MRTMIALTVIVLALSPIAASADTVFMPSINAGVRDWFTTADVLAWSAEAQNVMPIYCTAIRPDVYQSCIVKQAKMLTLIWDNDLGKVIAK